MSSVVNVASVKLGEFELNAIVDGSIIAMKATGIADMRVQEALDGALTEVHTHALGMGCKEVVVDFHHLDFMNSSCLKCLVTWIGKLQQLEKSKRYLVRLLSRKDVLWQRRSLHALRSFAVDFVSVES